MSVRKVYINKVDRQEYVIVSDSGALLHRFHAKSDKEAQLIAENFMSSYGSLALIEFKLKLVK